MVSRLKTVLEWPVPKDVQMHITCGKSWGCVDGVGQRILYVLELPISCSLLCCWSVGWLHYSREMGLTWRVCFDLAALVQLHFN